MYDRSVAVYDLVYAHKNYEAEAAWVRDTVEARNPEARTLLDVACGTGKHLEHLRHDFDCQGLDASPAFVEIAKGHTRVPVHLANMETFELPDRFDAITCLFSAIGHTTDLGGAIASMRRHLTAGGVLIVEPWFTPNQWRPGTLDVLDHEADGTRVVRMSHSALDGRVAVMEMHHLVGNATGVEHFVEEHRMTLFTLAEYQAAFRAAGLTCDLDEPGPFGRGALIGQPTR